MYKKSLKKLPGFTKAPTSPRKRCVMKIKERNKEKRKNNCRVKIFEGIYKAVSEEWLNRVYQLRDIDSSNNESTNCLVNGRIGQEKMVRRV